MTRATRRALVPGLAGVLLVLLVVLLLLVGLMVGLMAPTASGADPSPLPADLLASGDPRSEGAGPGLVGSPLLILLAVVGLGLAAAAVTALVARLVRRS